MDRRPYRWLDHTADLGMEVTGGSLPELFVNAARGLYELLGAPFEVGGRREEELRVRGADLEELLAGWLGELLYRAGVEGRFYQELDPEVEQGSVHARLTGGTLPRDERRRMREIKAVTYHDLEVRETSQGWKARVIFDV